MFRPPAWANISRVTRPPIAIALCAANAALAVTLPAVGVFGIVSMSARAMCSSGLNCAGGAAAKCVDPLRNGFKVVRVHTSRVFTEMVNREPRCNWPLVVPVGESVSVPGFAVHPERPVSVSVVRASPNPAGLCFINEPKESHLRGLFLVERFSRNALPVTHIVDIHTPVRYLNWAQITTEAA